jgi:uncharacterized protein (TIGR03435 family)
MPLDLRPPLVAVLVAGSALVVQSQERSFEAVSIKRNQSATMASDTNTTPGRLSLMNVTLVSVVRRAFRVLDPQIVGAPEWLFRDRYDIVAVTGDDTALTDEARQRYLQTLLAERCQFRFHREMREIRVYSLVASKNGLKLTAHNGPGDYGMRVQPTEGGRFRLSSTRGNMSRLAEILTGQVGELVIDRTGLSGEYDFTLEWAPNLTPAGDGPSVFTALDEQLGLRLDSAKTPMQAIVIDRVERPSEN